MAVIKYKNVVDEPVTTEVISLSGEVIEINRSNKTHLHASGGGARASSSNGRSYASTSPISVSSTNSVHDDIYILTDTGEEVFIQLVNWEHAGIRKGHNIQVMWLRANINDKRTVSTAYAVVNNRNLNKVLFNDKIMKECTDASGFFALVNHFTGVEKIVIGLTLVLSIMTIILFPVFLFFIIRYLDKKYSKIWADVINEQMKPQLRELLLPPIRNQTQKT